MTDLFATTPDVRVEIGGAFEQLLEHWATGGASLTAAERLAVVEEVRKAQAAETMPPWQTPSSVPGLIDDAHPLDTATVDVVWRLTNHPGSISHDWYQNVVDGGLDPGRYVELVAVVAMACAMEHFCVALGIGSPTLPAASGSAQQPAPVDASVTTHWVPTVDGDLPNVRTALSAAPAELAMQGALLDALYVPGGALAVPLEQDVWSLQRTQLELVASRVSTFNECFY